MQKYDYLSNFSQQTVMISLENSLLVFFIAASGAQESAIFPNIRSAEAMMKLRKMKQIVLCLRIDREVSAV
jgi:hypothetical protein